MLFLLDIFIQNKFFVLESFLNSEVDWIDRINLIKALLKIISLIPWRISSIIIISRIWGLSSLYSFYLPFQFICFIKTEKNTKPWTKKTNKQKRFKFWSCSLRTRYSWDCYYSCSGNMCLGYLGTALSSAVTTSVNSY